MKTIAKGSEKSISEQAQTPICLMESKGTMYGDFEIDLQGAPEQSLVSEVIIIIFFQYFFASEEIG